MSDFVFHLPRSWLSLGGEGIRPFYTRIFDGLEARDIPFDVQVLEREHLAETVAADTAIHIIHHGRFAHPRARNADVAYIYPFWNFDPKGIRAFSSIADTAFPQGDIDPDLARPFFRRLRQRIVNARTSRYEQPEGHTPLDPVKAAIFLQSEGHRVVGETCYLDRWDMVAATCEATDGPVVVKPHPRDTDPGTVKGLADLQTRYPQLDVFHGNIHDLISVAERVVTINSAVGIEAYLHRTPVVLCGQSDFHHIADVAQDQQGLRDILARAPRKRVYDKYIWWYFADRCLDASAGDLVDRFCARCAI